MAFPTLNTQTQLALWIKRQLGWPTINIELEDDVIIDNINHALQFYNKYSGDARYKSALIVQLSAGIDEYTLPDNVANVLDFDTTQVLGVGAGTLFTLENRFYNEGILNISAPSTETMVSWELAMTYLETLQDKLIPGTFVNFNKFTKKIKIVPKPQIDLVGILEVYTYYTHGTTSIIYSELWVKRYSLALTKIVLANVWGKYQGIALPGGGTLNSETIRTEALEEKKSLEDDLISQEEEPLGFYSA